MRRKNQQKIKKLNALEYLVDKRKIQLLKYAVKKAQFYQREAAFELHWSVGMAQYYLKKFVQHGLLAQIDTSYKTYYQPTSLLIKLSLNLT